MDFRNKSLYRLLFLIGVILTLIAAGIAIWPDLEARNFSQTFRGRDRASFSCPIAITAAESANVRLNLQNPLERRARFAAISFISIANQTTTPYEERQEIYIDAQQDDRLEWTIDESNRVYDNMVLARVYVFRSGRAASQSATCGVWLFTGNWAVNSGLSGQAIYLIFASIGLLLLAVGGIGASEGNPVALVDRSTGQLRFGMVVTTLAIFALAVGMYGAPMLGLAAIVIVVILLFALLDLSPNRPPIDS